MAWSKQSENTGSWSNLDLENNIYIWGSPLVFWGDAVITWGDGPGQGWSVQTENTGSWTNQSLS